MVPHVQNTPFSWVDFSGNLDIKYLFPILVKFLLAQVKVINTYLENIFLLFESQTAFVQE